MSVLKSHARWLAPATAVIVVIGGGVAVGALTAAAEPDLPPRSAAQLLVDLQSARLDGLSGTVVQSAELGLPALPGIGAQGSADLMSLLAGTHTLRVWYSGPDKARVALVGTAGETDVITNGTDVWTWSSKENKATHTTLPIGTDRASTPPGGSAVTPQQLADLALAAVNPSTQVTVDDAVRVADRDAYVLRLSPRDGASRINSVRLAIDAREHVPLRVQVFARGSGDPSVEVAFTTVSFSRPDDAQFAFNPPPGVVVEEIPAPEKQIKPDRPNNGGATPAPVVIGSGWMSVLVARLPEPAGDPIGDGTGEQTGQPGPGGQWPRLTDMFGGLTRVTGDWGSGRLLTSRLFSILVTDDGRVLIGAVNPERLYQAAADPAAKIRA